MNPMSNQQGQFSNQQLFNNQQQSNFQNRYQPAGYVQSHYQGLPKNAFANSSPVIAHTGYSAAPQQSYGISSSNAFAQNQNNAYGASNSNVGPVISHVGYQAGQDFYPTGTTTSMGSNFSNQQSAQTGQQPVISHVGYTAGQNFQASGSQYGQQHQQQLQQNQNFNQNYSFNQNQPAGQSFGGSYGGSSNFAGNAHAATSYNPVYQATNAAANSGPVISKLGYSAGTQQGGAYQSAQGGYGVNSGFLQRF
ncbi:hypothetical protein PAECIP111893_02674 [Paenibacillus plantiphilus]|uniref:Small, acid-soluble spore protein gamma-type n=1 Tax=Paenibacillus plantiphilus TaxID=2905650 RepID=A0ABM9C9S3_9BACL|nr:hypothetical protein [Paenibacillus plantiphilus]CAH1207021.1 hypothetical protein PAECIP111893_02674 [Paenibacillus plantiphilus]